MKTITELLAELVAMPTITDDIPANDMALDYLERYFSERGLHCRQYRYDGHGALVATTRRHRKRMAVMLAAHVDVLTAPEGLFTLRTDGDRLLGRGVYDMKFAIAAFMQLTSQLHRENTLDDYDFGILITTDEEYGGRDGINAIPHILDEGYLPDVCVLPDGGTNYAIERIAKGHWRFELVAKGRTAHGARPWEGESASFKIIEALRDIKDHFRNHGPTTDTLNIGYIHGGEVFNQIPDHIAAAVEIRTMHADSPERLRPVIEDICRRHDVHYRTAVVQSPTVTDTNNAFVQNFMQSVQAVTGKKIETCISYGASDGAYFAAHGIPCILTRPEGGGHHGGVEWISRPSLELFTPVLRHYLDSAAKFSTPVDKTPANAVQ